MATIEPDSRTLVGLMSFEQRRLYALADAILKRLRDNRGKTAAGSYLLGSPTGRVFVIAEGSSCGIAVVRTFEHLIVGRYAANQPAPGKCFGNNGVEYPSCDDLVEDLRAYYAEVNA